MVDQLDCSVKLPMRAYYYFISDLSRLLNALSADTKLKSLLFDDQCDLGSLFSRLDQRCSRSFVRRIVAESIANLSSHDHVG